jgi:hypothetical protein
MYQIVSIPRNTVTEDRRSPGRLKKKSDSHFRITSYYPDKKGMKAENHWVNHIEIRRWEVMQGHKIEKCWKTSKILHLSHEMRWNRTDSVPQSQCTLLLLLDKVKACVCEQLVSTCHVQWTHFTDAWFVLGWRVEETTPEIDIFRAADSRKGVVHQIKDDNSSHETACHELRIISTFLGLGGLLWLWWLNS